MTFMTFCSDFDSLDRFALTLIVLTDTNVVSQGFVGESLLPAGPENFGQKVQSGDDMLVEGYPRGLLIQENIYPIIKSSCGYAKWGSYFDGNPCIIIDRRPWFITTSSNH